MRQDNSQVIADLISALDRIGVDPRFDLGEELFLLISRFTPIVNVDLLLKDSAGRTLLAWREDRYYHKGWHVPGGIVRFKERFTDRIRAVAHGELGVAVRCDEPALAVHETIDPARSERGHFISLLYRCEVLGEPDPQREFVSGQPIAGQWKWHTHCPENLINIHEMYRPYL